MQTVHVFLVSSGTRVIGAVYSHRNVSTVCEDRELDHQNSAACLVVSKQVSVGRPTVV